MTRRKLKEIAARAKYYIEGGLGRIDAGYLLAKEDVPALIAEVQRLQKEQK